LGVSGLLTISVNAQSINTQAEMHQRVVELYNFSPHKLTDAGRKTKSAEMDVFWGEVKTHPNLELPLLRVELRDTSNPAFFMEDGSELLTSLSKDQSDRQLAVDARARCDLADVRPDAYFYFVHELSMEGVDTTLASLHILDDPAFAVHVPQHAMTLDHGMSLVYLLLPVALEKWMPTALARFETEKNEAAKESLLTLFFYVQTKEGDAALEAAAHDMTQSPTIRKDALHHQQDVKDVLLSKHNVKGSESMLREARRKRLGAVSDESIDDVQEMTAQLIQLRGAQEKSKL